MVTTTLSISVNTTAIHLMSLSLFHPPCLLLCALKLIVMQYVVYQS